MVEMRSDLPPLPERMRGLAISARGYPVPKFVQYIDGEPDFRVMNGEHFAHCVQFETCWLCGGNLGRARAFVVGPMCAVNRVSSEPPSHLECATYAATACPFLSRPHARRREDETTANGKVAGFSIKRNPGVTLVWVSRTGKPFSTPADRARGIGPGILFDIGLPLQVLWIREGRAATRDEVLKSIDEGFPALRSMAETEGPAAVQELERLRLNALALVPVE